MVVSPGYDPRGPIRHTKKIVLSLVPQDSKPNYVRLPDGEKEGFRNYSSSKSLLPGTKQLYF